MIRGGVIVSRGLKDVLGLPGVIDSYVVSAVRLVNSDISLGCKSVAISSHLEMQVQSNLLPHVVPVLRGMHARFERRRPRGSIHCSSFVLGARERLPVDEQGYGIFGIFNAIVRFPCCNAGSCACNDAGRNRLPLQDPAANVNVVRRKIVASHT